LLRSIDFFFSSVVRTEGEEEEVAEIPVEDGGSFAADLFAREPA